MPRKGTKRQRKTKEEEKGESKEEKQKQSFAITKTDVTNTIPMDDEAKARPTFRYASLEMPTMEDLKEEKSRKQWIDKYLKIYREELYERELEFWLKNSVDEKHGGYYNCLDDDGKVYDTTKHMWLNCREIWMLSRLACSIPADTKDNKKAALRERLLHAAKVGAEFAVKHGMNSDKTRVYFALDETGKPVMLQRKLFSECFFVMACAMFSRASGDKSYYKIAVDMFENILKYAADPSLLGRPVLSGNKPTSALNVPMIILNVIDEIRTGGLEETEIAKLQAELEAEKKQRTEAKVDEKTEWKSPLMLYADKAKWCMEEIMKHIKTDKKCVLETVGTDGSFINSPDGRLLNPGHAIEAGWFILQFNHKYVNDKKLDETALSMIDWSFEKGWDNKYGGLFYFLDSEGYSPTQLEWSLKLWWPHNETVIAFLMAYMYTNDLKYLYRFFFVSNYTFRTFTGSPSGGWFGYCDREGRVSQRFIGGAYKGCFHVPRSLFFCSQMLEKLL